MAYLLNTFWEQNLYFKHQFLILVNVFFYAKNASKFCNQNRFIETNASKSFKLAIHFIDVWGTRTLFVCNNVFEFNFLYASISPQLYCSHLATHSLAGMYVINFKCTKPSELQGWVKTWKIWPGFEPVTTSAACHEWRNLFCYQKVKKVKRPTALGPSVSGPPPATRNLHLWSM